MAQRALGGLVDWERAAAWQVERELLMPPGHAMPPGPASSGGAQAPLSPRRPSVATGTPGRIYAMTAKPGVMPLRRKSVR